VVLLLNTGLRVAELSELCWNDITIGKRNGLLIVRHGKGGKRREVPLNEDACEVLLKLGYATHQGSAERVLQGQRLIATESGEKVKGMTTRRIRFVVERIFAETIIDGESLKGKGSCHSLRHSFCKTLADENANMGAIADLAGHQSLDTTRRYCQASPAELQEVVGRLSVRRFATDH
jgi:integrase/recombinase XerC